MYQSSGVAQLDSLAESYQAQVADLCQENTNSHAALEIVSWISDTTVYPLAVLLEATARATAIPLTFWLDLTQSFANSILNKHAFVQLTERYETKNRYWMVGTANPTQHKVNSGFSTHPPIRNPFCSDANHKLILDALLAPLPFVKHLGKTLPFVKHFWNVQRFSFMCTKAKQNKTKQNTQTNKQTNKQTSTQARVRLRCCCFYYSD